MTLSLDQYVYLLRSDPRVVGSLGEWNLCWKKPNHAISVHIQPALYPSSLQMTLPPGTDTFISWLEALTMHQQQWRRVPTHLQECHHHSHLNGDSCTKSWSAGPRFNVLTWKLSTLNCGLADRMIFEALYNCPRSRRITSHGWPPESCWQWSLHSFYDMVSTWLILLNSSEDLIWMQFRDQFSSTVHGKSQLIYTTWARVLGSMVVVVDHDLDALALSYLV